MNIKNGTRPAKNIHKERRWHDHFFGVIPANIPDFNLDSGLNGMPDQNADGAPFECVGYTTSDIGTDVIGKIQDPDFSYAASRYVSGDGAEGIGGTSFHGGLQGAVALGFLQKSLATVSASVQGEKYVSDWNNWPAQLKKTALASAQNGILNVLGMGDDFDSILSACYTGKIGISIATAWYLNWDVTAVKYGIVQAPSNPQDVSNLGWHNWAIKGKKTIDGIPYLIGKTWQGTSVGDNGWMYFSREAINGALSVQGSGALTLNPNAKRWASIIGILVQRFPALLSELPQLLNANN